MTDWRVLIFTCYEYSVRAQWRILVSFQIHASVLEEQLKVLDMTSPNLSHHILFVLRIWRSFFVQNVTKAYF